MNCLLSVGTNNKHLTRTRDERVKILSVSYRMPATLVCPTQCLSKAISFIAHHLVSLRYFVITYLVIHECILLLYSLLTQLTEVNDLGFITYVSDSTTLEARRMLRASPSDVTKLPSGTFLLPTFCDLHLHAPQFLYQGTGLHLPLMQWLDEYAFKAEESLDANPTLARKVYERLADRLIENGTAAVLLFGTIKEETKSVLHLLPSFSVN